MHDYAEQPRSYTGHICACKVARLAQKGGQKAAAAAVGRSVEQVAAAGEQQEPQPMETKL
jgi:hypothetical protein